LGDYEGDTSFTRLYLAHRAEGVPQHHGWESEAVLLAHPEDLPKLLNKQRDRDVAADLMGHPKHPWNASKAPVPGPTPQAMEAVKDATLPDYFDMGHWKQTGPQLGSNPGGEYTTTGGQKWYVKFPKTEEHARNEQLTNELYRLTGANVPHTMIVKQGDKIGIASHMLPEHMTTMDKASPEAQKLLHPGLHEHFATDAWLANRDVLGLTNDNIMYHPGTNQTVRIDQGGGLHFRAQGEPKTDFGGHVSEWDYMLNKGKAKAVFGSMTPEKQVESINRVLDVPGMAIHDAISKYGPKDPAKANDLFEKLLDRQNHLKNIRDVTAAKIPAAAKGEWPSLESEMEKLLNRPSWLETVKAKTGPLAAPKPEAVTFATAGREGDFFVHAGDKKVGEITHLGRDHPTHPNMYMVEMRGSDEPIFFYSEGGAKKWAELGHNLMESTVPKAPPPSAPARAQTEPWLAKPKKPSAETDLGAAAKKGESPDNPLTQREVRDLTWHHGEEALKRAPYAPGPGETSKYGASKTPTYHDPLEVIPKEKDALKNMLLRWMQAGYPEAKQASPFQQMAFRGVRKAPREFPTPGSDLEAYYSTSDPALAMRYAIGEGTRPEHFWQGSDPMQQARVQHLLLDTRNYLHVDAEGKDWTEVHRYAANEAARRGKHGVVINRTHDEPSASPRHPPVTVYLTFRPGMHTIRTRGAEFDPAKFGKLGLKHGIAGPGIVAAYSHAGAPEEYDERGSNALGAR
jgi:hypothetical protein